MPVWLNEADVRSVLTMGDLIPSMERALLAFSQGRVAQPVRSVIEIKQNESFFGVMPAYVSEITVLGAKLVTVFGRNPNRGLPSHLATILVFDPDNGEVLSIMDGRFITEARTAAVSAVAARYLSRPNARVVAVLGSGVQARSHVEAIVLVRSFDEVRCWSPNRSHLEQFAHEFPKVRPMPNAEAAVRGAGLIILVTSSPHPVIRAEWVEDGACVISVGACRPNQREMDPDLVARSRLFVDSREAALKESGDVLLGLAEGRFTKDHIIAELGEVIARPSFFASSRQSVTIFKSLGLAIEDLAAAHLVYNRARVQNRGQQLA